MNLIDHKFWLAINDYHEARGEPIEGRVAVCHVVMNRCLMRGVSVKEIILAPWQFSWHNHNSYPPIDDYEAFRESLNVAEKVLIERLSGKNLWGADHYFNPSKVLPSWAEKMEFVKAIDNHHFYRS